MKRYYLEVILNYPDGTEKYLENVLPPLNLGALEDFLRGYAADTRLSSFSLTVSPCPEDQDKPSG